MVVGLSVRKDGSEFKAQRIEKISGIVEAALARAQAPYQLDALRGLNPLGFTSDAAAPRIDKYSRVSRPELHLCEPEFHRPPARLHRHI